MKISPLRRLLLVFILGVIITLMIFMTAKKIDYLERDGISVDAMVISESVVKGQPMVQFVYWVEGKDYVQATFDCEGCEYGDKIALYVDPENPREFRFQTSTRSSVYYWVGFVIGGLSLLFTLFNFRSYLKSNNKK